MPTLLFELGTEEMPANAVAPALRQLQERLLAGFAQARLAPSAVLVEGTPRRLVAHVRDLPARQPDQPREARGPAKSIAFDSAGNPTGAAIGFARKQGVSVEDLQVVSTPQGEYVVARVLEAGRPGEEVVPEVLTEALRSLSFPKTMRWGECKVRFVRPVRWILCLLDERVVPMEFAGVHSGRESRGHRYLSPGSLAIASVADYPAAMRSAHVMTDPAERAGEIRRQADALAQAAGGSIPWDEDLLEENVWLVEWPTAVLGQFDSQYLELPRPVLVMAMKKHQRFFPVQDSEGRLLPRFVAIRNGGDHGLEVVREGNERVLTARFADAAHFYSQDKQIPLETMAAELHRLTFQDKLGTMQHKRERLMHLAAALARSSGLAAVEAQACRAASLCKADLVSRVVVELPALQGTIGREYALLHGEPREIADAIAEHYQPRTAADSLPASPLGRLLAVADRLDTLVGHAGLGILPTGSSDPFGLRRAAHGIVQMLAEEPDYPPLIALQVMAADAYMQVNGLDFDLDNLCNNLKGLFDQRLTVFLQDRGIRYDLVEAALAGGLIYSSLVYSLAARAEALQRLTSHPQFVSTVQSAARVANILRSAGGAPAGSLVPGKEGIHGEAFRTVERAVSVLESELRKVDTRLLAEPAEEALYAAASRTLAPVAQRATEYRYEELFEILAPLSAPIDRFFDEVLVMVEDAGIRANRLALLAAVDALYRTLADFTRVVLAPD